MDISDFLKTGDKLEEEREASFKQIERNSSVIIDSVQDLQIDSRDSLWSAGVLSDAARWIGRTAESTLESVAALKEDVAGVKGDVAEVHGELAGVGRDVERVGRGVLDVKTDTEILVKRGIKLPGYLWFFRIATLAALAILTLMLYRACSADKTVESLAVQQNTALEELASITDNLFEDRDDSAVSQSEESAALGILNKQESTKLLDAYAKNLGEVVGEDTALPTSSTVVEKWFSLMEKGNQDRTIAILDALSKIESSPPAVPPKVINKIDVAVDGKAVVEAQADKVSIVLIGTKAEECSFASPCEIDRVSYSVCKVETAESFKTDYVTKLAEALDKNRRADRTTVIEFRGSADLRGAGRCSTYKDNISLSVHRAQNLRKTLSSDAGYLELIKNNPEVMVSVGSEPIVRGCEVGEATKECNDKSRYARVVLYTYRN